MGERPARWKVAAVLGLHGLVVWGLCGATIAVGRAFLPMQTTLVVHAVVAPLVAAGASLHYSARFGYTGPLATATFFLSFVVVVDFLLVALVLERSLDMFRSALGTWIPFASIFAAAFAAGAWRRSRTRPAQRAGAAIR